MRKNTRLWLVLFMVMGMALSLGGVASAQTNPFPATKQPSSGRFDISGFYKISASGGGLGENLDINATISGGGAFSGQNMQMDMTINMDLPESEGSPSGAGGPSSTTISMIIVDGKLYMKMPGLSGEDRWVVTDAGEMGAGGPMGGMTGGVGGMTGLDPSYAEAFTVTEEGKENLNGAPTTRYRIDVDYEKLMAAMGSEMGTPMPEDASSQMTYVMHLWIGDNDMYLHKMHMLLDSTTTMSDSTLRMTIDFTFAFRDFDQPITITAPANAEEIDLSSSGLNPNVLPAVAGMPGNVATGMGMGMPAIGTGMAGMPRTGMPSSTFPTEILALAALGMLCMVLGTVARRVSVRG